MAARDIIIKPLLSEKSYAGIKDKKYSFVVAKNANEEQKEEAVRGVVRLWNLGKVIKQNLGE